MAFLKCNFHSNNALIDKIPDITFCKHEGGRLKGNEGDCKLAVHD